MLSHSPRNVEPEPGSNDNISLRSVLRNYLLHETARSQKKIFPSKVSGLSNQPDNIVVRSALTIYSYSLGLFIFCHLDSSECQ